MRHPLAAEVVDHERAAVALQLQRRFADVGGRVERHFELIHRELAADDDRGPADADPAVVDLAVVEQAFVGGQRHFFVHAGVEQPHDLAVDADRPRNPDELAEGLGDPLGDAGLAVAGAPYRNKPRPELIAGPRRISMLLSINRSSNARCRSSSVGMLIGKRLMLDAVDVRVRAAPARRRSTCSVRQTSWPARGPAR